MDVNVENRIAQMIKGKGNPMRNLPEAMCQSMNGSGKWSGFERAPMIQTPRQPWTVDLNVA